jgi:hypothetical protein
MANPSVEINDNTSGTRLETVKAAALETQMNNFLSIIVKAGIAVTNPGDSRQLRRSKSEIEIEIETEHLKRARRFSSAAGNKQFESTFVCE